MPFIPKDRRERIDLSDEPPRGIPGDTCYWYYKAMVDRWRRDPRWTTAHIIYTSLGTSASEKLAWQVFFQLCVMPYELKKREENGDI